MSRSSAAKWDLQDLKNNVGRVNKCSKWVAEMILKLKLQQYRLTFSEILGVWL